MNYHLAFIIYIVPALLLMVGLNTTLSAQTGATPVKSGPFTVLSSSAEGIVVEYAPQIEAKETEANGRRYRYYDGSAAATGEPGAPPVYSESIIIGRPPESAVELRITSEELNDETGARLLPNPRSIESDGLPTPYYLPDDSAYSSGEWGPRALASVGEEGMYRDYPVARIDFHPVRYLPSGNRYQVVRRLIVEIRFSGGANALQGRNFASFPKPAAGRSGGIERNLILNYREAQGWRVRSTPVRKRADNIPQEGRWFFIPMTEEGIYRMTGEALSNAGITISNVNPANIRMWNNGGLALPQTKKPDAGIPGRPVKIKKRRKSFVKGIWAARAKHGI